jgi:hypothetical protein
MIMSEVLIDGKEGLMGFIAVVDIGSLLKSVEVSGPA